MAHHQQARHARKHHADLPAFPRPGAEPGRERLAVSPSELDLKHRLRTLRRHYRCCPRRMAETDRQARNHHIHRNARLGPRRSVTMTFGMRRSRSSRFGTVALELLVNVNVLARIRIAHYRRSRRDRPGYSVVYLLGRPDKFD